MRSNSTRSIPGSGVKKAQKKGGLRPPFGVFSKHQKKRKMEKKLGGGRLGSGGKMEVGMHGYGKATSNLSTIVHMSMAPGPLYPVYSTPYLLGDEFEIDVDHMVITEPTLRPLYGSFKLQVDFFVAPLRLYIAELHNNPLNVGLHPEKIYLPMMNVFIRNITNATINDEPSRSQIHPQALISYFNISGAGKVIGSTPSLIKRQFHAVKALMYPEIFKNYYANKQEENAYVMAPAPTGLQATIYSVQFEILSAPSGQVVQSIQCETPDDGVTWQVPAGGVTVLPPWPYWRISIFGTGVTTENVSTTYTVTPPGTNKTTSISEMISSTATKVIDDTPSVLIIGVDAGSPNPNAMIQQGIVITNNQSGVPATNVALITPFPLQNIDDMRETLLAQPSGTPFVISQDDTSSLGNTMPYGAMAGTFMDVNSTTRGAASVPMSGFLLKTYQSDRFNNWLDTEFITGTGGITQRTAISTEDGSFDLDTLNVMEKMYNVLNRIAAAGSTFDDFQEATYGRLSKRYTEIPLYMGGTSMNITFQEVISTSATEDQPLGDLAGKGLAYSSGKKVYIKNQEWGYIMAIASITPRITYSQGNAWDTRLRTLDDFHKPELDTIGYQDLLTDELAAFDTTLTLDSNNVGIPQYKSAGKQPSWVEYTTDINRAYGRFKMDGDLMSMTLNRQYEWDPSLNLKDLTTYIDPRKYNYAFAQTSLEAENFWVMLKFDVKAKRVKSNTEVPNL